MSESAVVIIVNAIVTLGGVAGGVAVAYIALRSKQLDMDAKSVATNSKLDKVATNVQKIETHTNSLTEKLVALTDKEAYGRGTADEKAKAEAIASEDKLAVGHMEVTAETMTVTKQKPE